jgi:hypothetical protein
MGTTIVGCVGCVGGDTGCGIVCGEMRQSSAEVGGLRKLPDLVSWETSVGDAPCDESVFGGSWALSLNFSIREGKIIADRVSLDPNLPQPPRRTFFFSLASDEIRACAILSQLTQQPFCRGEQLWRNVGTGAKAILFQECPILQFLFAIQQPNNRNQEPSTQIPGNLASI